jgi:DNA-binding CsgD family transcriptional regulator
MNGSRHALAALQRFAAVGVSDRLAFPELVRLLSELAPFETSAMLWLGPDHLPVDTYTNIDCAPEYLARYAERWFNREERRFHPCQMDMQLDPALNVIRVSDYTPRFGESELYDEVYSPAEHHWIAGLALRDGGRPIGNLGIGRPPGMPDFSDEEIRTLKLARPYVVQALARTGELEGWPEIDVEDEAAMVVVDRAGVILHATPNAWRLLHGAAGAPADVALLSDRVYAWARPLLEGLAERVAAGFQGVSTPPARLESVTAYGRFVLRAYAFEPGGDVLPRSFGVQIEKRLPLGVKMFRSTRFRDLTPREQDIARLLSTGLSYPRIAAILDLGASTVVTHVRNLGQKLGVASRDEIVRALCS